MPPINRIQAPGTARPVGHYSQAVVHNGLVYVSGQVPSDLATGQPETGPIEQQTERSLGNLATILKAAGSGLEHVLQMTIFISSIDDWPAVNATYARIMGESRPSRAIVPVAPLHYGTAIEIMCVAALPRKTARKPAARTKAAGRKRSTKVRTRRRVR
ncbi:MAG: RidA family protein [Gemmatimonadales bacterium]